jgi:hypothetical protein
MKFPRFLIALACLMSGFAATITFAAAPTATTTAATNVSTTSATINGTVNPNGTSTSAYFDWGTSTNYANSTSAIILSGTTTQAIHANLTGLSPNTTYHYRVAAGSTQGAGFGTDVSFKTSPTPTPTATPTSTPSVGPPTINSPGATSSPGPELATLTPTFSWNSVTGATGYGLYIFDATTNSFLWQNVGGPRTGTSYTLPTGYLSNNHHAYYWFMTSFSASGESSSSNARYFQAPTPIIGPPTINSPGATSSPGPELATLTPTFSWNPVNGATGYGLYIFDLTTNSFLFQNVGGPRTGTSYTLPSGYLSNNRHAYRWFMSSFSASGESSTSDALYFQAPIPIIGPPTINSPGTVSSPGPDLATFTPIFSWNSVSGASGYGLYIFDITTNSFLFQNVGGPKTGTSYTLPTGYLSNNHHSYRWFMSSFSSSGESSTSDALYFQAPTIVATPTPSPSATPGPTATPTATATGTAVLPTVQTVSANVSQTSVVINGTITDNGGSVIDDRRFDWGPTQPLGNAVFALSISVSGNNFSATLTGLSPNTRYYFRAWAHNGSSANSGYGVGWNTGAILSFSTAASSNIASPGIVTQPSDGTIPTDGSLVLNVAATGTDLHYRWFRDGTAILGATTSTVSVNLPAAYWVTVSNGGGEVTSRHAVVVSATAVPPPPAGQPQPGAATWTGRIDPSLPTVVITHGWQPGIAYNGSPPDWVSQMGLEIFNRFERAKYPPKINGQRANIVFFTWPEAYTLFPLPAELAYAATHTHHEGLRLASELRRILGAQYSGDIHFIGHSLGTIVNAYAIEDYAQSYAGQTQFTILDAPLKFTPYTSLFFEEHLSRFDVSWVDNYIGTDHSLPTPGVGDVIPGAAPDGGLKKNTDHVGVHDFYLGTITNDSSNLGFYNSLVLDLAEGWQKRPSPQNWRPDFSADAVDVIIDMGAHLPEIAGEGFHLLQGAVQQTTDNVRGAVRESIHMITGLFGGSGPLRSQMQATCGVDLLTAELGSNDASVALDVTVPVTTDTLTFDYRFPTITPGDWMTVTFNSTLLYSFPADPVAQGDFRNAEVSVGSIAGQTGILMVTLHSTSSTQTELAISNFRFSAAKAHRPKFANIATRLSVGTGDNAMIGGFIITGTQPKTILVRGIGPSLGAVGVPEPLSDPIIEIRDSTGALIPGGTNDNWHDAVTSLQIAGSGLAPTNDLESAFLGTLNPGAYTVVVRGKDGGIGNGLFEVYDLNQLADSKLGNISTRGFVNTGDRVMIGGTIIVGNSPTDVLVRAIGPSLSNFGISNALSDPVLDLHDGNGGLIGSNDNWRDTQETAIIATSIPPTDNRESAILANLQPGQYTAVIRGSGDSTGVAVVEAYQLTPPTPTPTATPVPTSTPVMPFSDNFDGNALDRSKWTVENAGSATIGNGIVSIAAGGGNWSGTISTIGKVVLPGQPYTVEFRARRTADYDLNFNLTDGTNTLNVMESSYSGNFGFRLNTSGAFGTSNQGNPNPTTNWKEYRVTVDGTTVTAQRGDSLSNLTETLIQTLAAPPANYPLFLRIGNAGPNTVEVDWVTVTSH